MMLENLLNKYEENRRLTNEQLSVYDCVIRDIKKLLGKED